MKHLVATCMLSFVALSICYGNISFSNFTYNVQPVNVLRVDVSFSVSPAARAYVEYFYLDGTDTIWGYTNISDSASAHSFTMVGLVAQKNYGFRAAAFDDTGIHYDTWNTLTTASLPAGLPSITSIPVADAANTGGYVMTHTMRLGTSTFGDVAQIFDRLGNMVWYQFLDSIATGGFYQCKYAYPVANERVAISGCHEIVEIGLDGTVFNNPVLQGVDTNYYFHHEVIKKPNGNYLAIAAKPIRLDFSDVGATNDSLVIAEAILEIDPLGNVVWRWEADAELDTNNLVEQLQGNTWFTAFPGSGSWLHANALAIDVDGGLLLSFRKSSQVFKINPNNNNTLFIIGNLGTLVTPLSQRFKGQHCITNIGGNRYMVFDNQGKDTLSRVTEYFINGYNNSATIRWEYVLPANLRSDFFGSAYRLPNNNTLIGTGLGSAIVEVDSAGQNVMLDMRVNEPHYRAYPIPSLYAVPPAITFAIADTFCGPQFTPVTLAAGPAPGFFSGPGVTGNVFDPAAAGIGVHYIVYHYGWHTKAVRVNVGCIGIETVELSQIGFELYPNPSTGFVNFTYQLPQSHQANWMVVDLTGKEVAAGTTEAQSGQVEFSVDLSNLGKGSYIAVLEIDGQRTYSRLVLQ